MHAACRGEGGARHAACPRAGLPGPGASASERRAAAPAAAWAGRQPAVPSMRRLRVGGGDQASVREPGAGGARSERRTERSEGRSASTPTHHSFFRVTIDVAGAEDLGSTEAGAARAGQRRQPLAELRVP